MKRSAALNLKPEHRKYPAVPRIDGSARQGRVLLLPGPLPLRQPKRTSAMSARAAALRRSPALFARAAALMFLHFSLAGALASEAETSASASSRSDQPRGTAAASARYQGDVGFARTDARSGRISLARGVAVGLDENGIAFSASHALATRFGIAVAGNFNMTIGLDGRVATSTGTVLSTGPLHRSASAGGSATTGRPAYVPAGNRHSVLFRPDQRHSRFPANVRGPAFHPNSRRVLPENARRRVLPENVRRGALRAIPRRNPAHLRGMPALRYPGRRLSAAGQRRALRTGVVQRPGLGSAQRPSLGAALPPVPIRGSAHLRSAATRPSATSWAHGRSDRLGRVRARTTAESWPR